MNSIKYAALLLTHNCNLRCAYCYAGEKTSRRMSDETALASIDFLFKESSDKVVVTFFGGEPLLEYRLMKKIVLAAEEKYGGGIQFRMATNGTLLNREILDFFKEHKIYFTLSLDGGKRQQDTLRLTAGGKGTFDDITKNLDDILKFNPYTIAVSVITPTTAGMLAEGVQDLFRMGFRYVMQILDFKAAWTAKDLKLLAVQYRKLSKWYETELKDGRKLYYSPFDERIKTWSQRPFELGSLCDLGDTQIAVAPSGRIYPCVQFVSNDIEGESDYVLGDVYHGFDKEKRRTLVQRNLSPRPECDGCSLNGRCANYCGCLNWSTTGDILRVSPVLCEYERMLMPIVDRMANRLWKSGSRRFRQKFYDPVWSVSSFVEDCRMGNPLGEI